MRPIDADYLKEFIDNGRVCDICPNKKLNCAIGCTFPDTLTPLWEKVIDNAPTVEERPHGEWITVSDKYGENYKCPFCDKEILGTDLNFCVKCGADMRGGRE